MIVDRESEVNMYILISCSILCTVILFLVCNKNVNNDEVLYNDNISLKLKELGTNEVIATDILNYIGNKKTKVETNEDPKVKASFYNGNTNKIVIKNTCDLEDYSRVVHIAHECIHSIQDKKLIKTQFILSNIQILYFLGIFIYFFYNKNMELRLWLLLVQVFIFIATFFIKVTLESDASYRGPQLAFEYLEEKVGSDEIENIKKEVNGKLYKMIPISYFSLYMQGAMLMIIAQVGAILI